MHADHVVERLEATGRHVPLDNEHRGLAGITVPQRPLAWLNSEKDLLCTLY